MKKYIVLLLLTCFIRLGFAQQTKDTAFKKNEPKNCRFSIGGSLGYGWPTEEYGTGVIYYQLYGPPEYSSSGWANPGFHFDANVNYQISKQCGVLIEAAGNINSFNPEYLPSGGYYFGEYLAGPFYSKTFHVGNIFEVRLAMGMITLHDAEPTPVRNNYIIPHTWSNSSTGWGIELGLKYKKRIINRLYITFEIAYSQADAKAPQTPSNYIQGLSFVTGLIGIVTGGIGLEFKF